MKVFFLKYLVQEERKKKYNETFNAQCSQLDLVGKDLSTAFQNIIR